MNIGDEISYEDDFGRRKSGVLSAIGSDKDSYDDLKLENGIFFYKSKKLGKYVPVKDKSMESIYIEVTGFASRKEYILPTEVLNY
jgi:hypothetical protein|tara:strand:+ start:1542 stop:1796 length:255 start_codon:yes stop_codon:yes gene_type:complete